MGESAQSTLARRYKRASSVLQAALRMVRGMQRRPNYLIILATVVAILAGSFVSAAPVARAADVPAGPCTIVWDGGAGTAAWLDAANWTDDRMPTVADDACVYAANAPTTGITLNGASNQVVNSLRTRGRPAGEHERRRRPPHRRRLGDARPVRRSGYFSVEQFARDDVDHPDRRCRGWRRCDQRRRPVPLERRSDVRLGLDLDLAVRGG